MNLVEKGSKHKQMPKLRSSFKRMKKFDKPANKLAAANIILVLKATY
jgi:hypothetical protein